LFLINFNVKEGVSFDESVGTSKISGRVALFRTRTHPGR